MDTVLRKITVHHGYVVAFHVVQVACHKHCQGCLTGSSFLRGDRHIGCFFHLFDNLFGYTSVRLRQRIAIHTYARISVRLSIHSLIRLHQRTTVRFSVHPYFNQSIRMWRQ
ncbi:hypothetical protein M084_4732 [Bacteroides fragilis str. 3988 T1]|nr:hypothetical protein M084_4732 [Bacteroides fragilis str. 3988 T1]